MLASDWLIQKLGGWVEKGHVGWRNDDVDMIGLKNILYWACVLFTVTLVRSKNLGFGFTLFDLSQVLPSKGKQELRVCKSLAGTWWVRWMSQQSGWRGSGPKWVETFLLPVNLDPSQWKLFCYHRQYNVRPLYTTFGPKVAGAYKCADVQDTRCWHGHWGSYWERRLLAENILQCEISPNPVLRVNSMVVGAGTNSVNGVMTSPRLKPFWYWWENYLWYGKGLETRWQRMAAHSWWKMVANWQNVTSVMKEGSR